MLGKCRGPSASEGTKRKCNICLLRYLSCCIFKECYPIERCYLLSAMFSIFWCIFDIVFLLRCGRCVLCFLYLCPLCFRFPVVFVFVLLFFLNVCTVSIQLFAFSDFNFRNVLQGDPRGISHAVFVAVCLFKDGVDSNGSIFSSYVQTASV